MKALVKTQKGKGFLELRDAPDPGYPPAGFVKIRIAACGICGTDIHVKHDEFPYWPPVILGHEVTGTVVEVGPECISAKVGDRIVAEPHNKACGVCYLCRTGNSQICAAKRSPGWGVDGAMTTFINYPEKLLHKIPDHMTFEQAAMVERRPDSPVLAVASVKVPSPLLRKSWFWPLPIAPARNTYRSGLPSAVRGIPAVGRLTH